MQNRLNELLALQKLLYLLLMFVNYSCQVLLSWNNDMTGLRRPYANISKFLNIDPSVLKFGILIWNAIPQIFYSYGFLFYCENIFSKFWKFIPKSIF